MGPFGWHVIEIDGHDFGEICPALDEAAGRGPTAIIARTVKGKGVSLIEGHEGWHGRPLAAAECERALAELGPADGDFRVEPRRLPMPAPSQVTASARPPAPDYALGDPVATREAFGKSLVQLGESLPDLVVLDADVGNSTYTGEFARAFPARFFQSYIAEQCMAGAALGLAACGKLPVAATFACFLTRAFDFIRMAAHSRPPHLVFCGTHAGVSVGEDGPSQMGLEDIAMFRSLGGVTVLSPCDAVSTARLTAAALRTSGLVYLRTARPKSPVIYSPGEPFAPGGSKLLRSGPNDVATIVATGITVHEALRAVGQLLGRGIAARVVDAYSIEPIDEATLRRCATETGLVVVVEDHHINGGLGDAVASAVGTLAPVLKLGVAVEPRSGSMQELLELCGISAAHIERVVAGALGVQNGSNPDRAAG